MASNDDEDKRRFWNLFKILAEKCGHNGEEIAKSEVALYDKFLRGYGYKRMADAMESIYMNRRKGDRFPSPIEIREIIDPQVSEKDEAVDLSNKIVAALSKKGYNWSWGYFRDGKTVYDGFDTFKECLIHNFGIAGYIVIERMGGWGALTSQKVNVGILRSQLRDAAHAIIVKDRAGLLAEEKEKVQLEAPEKVTKLIAGAVKTIEGAESEPKRQEPREERQGISSVGNENDKP